MHTVARIAPDDHAGFGDFERTETPVVLAGAARDWPAMRWTKASLTALLGAAEVKFKLSATGDHPNFRAATLPEMFATGTARFADFLELITTGPEAERAQRLITGDERFLLRRRDGVTTIDPVLAPLLDDVVVPELVPPEQLYTVWAWFSGKGARTWLHYDNNGCHNLNAQLTGTKECVLYPPSELARLAPFPLGGGNPAYNCSRLAVSEVPAEAVSLHARLEPGDLLFIPAWLFHAFVHTGELNCNINFWWKPWRPTLNPIAARQALLDAAAALGKLDGPTAEVLGRLDRALTGSSDRSSSG